MKNKNANLTSRIVYRMMSVLIALVIDLPIGTNLGLLRVLWAHPLEGVSLVSGQLLVTRGALMAPRRATFPALANLGLSNAEVLQAWSAFAKGSWGTHHLVMKWAKYVRQEGKWERSEYGRYGPWPLKGPLSEGHFRVKALDLTGFFRPCLKDCPTTHYDSAAGKALSAIPIGIVGEVGRIGSQRFTLPTALVRAEVDQPSEAVLEENLVRVAVEQMTEDEALTADRGFKPVTFIKAGCKRTVLRRPKNFTARRRRVPAYGGRGRKPWPLEAVRPVQGAGPLSRPEKVALRGAIVRPQVARCGAMPRTYRGKTTAATPPDRVETWNDPHSDVTVTAHVWLDVVLPDHPSTPPRRGA